MKKVCFLLFVLLLCFTACATKNTVEDDVQEVLVNEYYGDRIDWDDIDLSENAILYFEDNDDGFLSFLKAVNDSPVKVSLHEGKYFFVVPAASELKLKLFIMEFADNTTTYTKEESDKSITLVWSGTYGKDISTEISFDCPALEPGLRYIIGVSDDNIWIQDLENNKEIKYIER